MAGLDPAIHRLRRQHACRASPAAEERPVPIRGGAHEGSRHRRRPGRPLFRDPDEEGVAADAHHRVRAQPAGRHLRLRRGVLRRDARHLRGLRPRELSRHHRPLRLLGRHRDPFPRHDAPHRRQRLLRLLAHDAAEDPAGARARSASSSSTRPRSRRSIRRSATPIWWSRPTASIRACARHSPTVQAERRPAAELLLLDGLDAAVRRLHVLLPRDRARHLHRALLPVRARPLDLDHRDRPADLRARRARQARRGGVGAFRRRRVRRGAQRPPPDHQPLDLAQFPDHPLRALGRRQRRAARRRQGDRAFLDRLRHQARDGGCDRALRGVPRDRRAATSRRRSRISRRSGATRSRRPSIPPTCRWSGSSTSSASGTWTRRASPSA